jgi:hypothetical protein
VSVTTVLVPVSEGEAEALVSGSGREAAIEAIEAIEAIGRRASVLRARVARVDALRDELHLLLFEKWSAARSREGAITRFLKAFQKKRPAQAATGYDPFVQLFGRSLPVAGDAPRAVAARLSALLAMDEAAFESELAADLATFDVRAGALFRASPQAPSPETTQHITHEAKKLASALAPEGPLAPALDALVRLSAWSRPVWRLDGETLGGLLQELGIGIAPSRGGVLFEEVIAVSTERLEALPQGLSGFSGAGAVLTSAQVQSLAAAFRMQRGRLSHNAAAAEDDARIVMRHARLLEEATLFAEAEGLALAEAAGIEWHDRNR